MREHAKERDGGERTGGSRGWGRAVGTKQRSLAHILLCILLFWLANIQDGRPAVILGWRRDVRVLARARGRARVNKRVCIRAYRLYIYYIIYIYTRTHTYTRIYPHMYTRDVYLCVRGIQCTKQCTERCIYTREIIAIGGALVSSRYIDLPTSSLLPKTSSSAERPKRTPGSETSSGRCVRAYAFASYTPVTPLPTPTAFESDAFTRLL